MILWGERGLEPSRVRWVQQASIDPPQYWCSRRSIPPQTAHYPCKWPIGGWHWKESQLLIRLTVPLHSLHSAQISLQTSPSRHIKKPVHLAEEALPTYKHWQIQGVGLSCQGSQKHESPLPHDQIRGTLSSQWHAREYIHLQRETIHGVGWAPVQDQGSSPWLHWSGHRWPHNLWCLWMCCCVNKPLCQMTQLHFPYTTEHNWRHWGQRGSYLAGTLWVCWEILSNLLPLYPVGKLRVLLKLTHHFDLNVISGYIGIKVVSKF